MGDFELIAILLFVALAVFAVAALLKGVVPGDITGATGVLSLDEAADKISLADPSEIGPDDVYLVVVLRQSGELSRYEPHYTPDDAKAAMKSAYRRAKVDHIRIDRNTTRKVETWRGMYHGKGTREGRRLGGVSIVVTPPDS
ncbi:hypothetical protein [Salibaculum griseiflavum]|uniref:hypothetical protein n=1 Tax=Salibaculum griseiflavum TaxID=1914409 RepID=UPI0011B1DC72|nr:hypothetical protein [Salibaculum griseiflavum]